MITDKVPRSKFDLDPIRWVNRLLYNNDRLKPIASVGGVKVTSVQAIGEDRRSFKSG